MAPQLPPRTSPCVFLIDGYALIYRAFYALIARPLTTSRGENTSAAWGVVNFLQRLRATHRPGYLGWVNDSGLSFRHERYPAYKATRQKLTDELQADFDRGMERICAILDASHIPILTLNGFEADDVIGTLARQGTEQGVNVVIVSGDKDFHQLVRPGVWLLNPGRGGPASVEEQWVGVENGEERLGVAPGFVTDYLAMVGDSSDNVPGVPGIGEKTARELVDSYGSLESILDHAAEVTKKRPREALQQFREQALLSKELVTIRDDLPMTLDLDALRVREPDTARLRELYVELEFHSLARDLGLPPATSEAGAPSATATPTVEKVQTATNYRTVDTVAEVQELVDARAGDWNLSRSILEGIADPGSPVAFDPLRSTLAGLAIAVAPGEAYYLPLRHRDPERAAGELDLMAAGRIVERATGLAQDEPRKTPGTTRGTESIASRAIAAGAMSPVRNLPDSARPRWLPCASCSRTPRSARRRRTPSSTCSSCGAPGSGWRGSTSITMLASYVLDPGRRSHGLDVLAIEFLDHQMTSYEDLCGQGKAQIPYEQVPVDCARDYSCEDADMALRSAGDLRASARGARAHAAVPGHRDAARAGAGRYGVDRHRDRRGARSGRSRLDSSASGSASSARSTPPRVRSSTSTPIRNFARSCSRSCSSRCGRGRRRAHPPTPSVLQDLADAGHALPSLLLEYRELFKLEGTYLDALPAMLLPSDRRLHTSFSQTVASTGRLSSSDPNLQNIPIRRELGRDIRRGFIPRAGWLLLAADYSQVELRLLAHLSGDPAFVAAFQAGGDIHRQTASIIFGVPLDAVTPEMRARAKTINFATIYGQGAHALSQQLKIEFAEAKLFIATYFERFQGVRAFLDSAISHARERGYVQTIFGRRRYIPELRDRNFNIRAFGERLAQNSPIQGSAADLIKIAMIRIHHGLADAQGSARMLLQVHDELVFETPPDEADALRALVIGEMEHAAELSVPLVVDVGVGANWVDAKSS